MRLLLRDRVRRAPRFLFGSRPRAIVSALAICALAWLGWGAARAVRAELAYRDAERALARYDFPTARERLRLAGELRPGKAGVWLLAAQAARRDGDLAAAKDCLARYESLAGALAPEAALERSLRQVQQGEVETGVYHLTSLVDSGHPASEQILEALAVGSVQVYYFDRAGFWVHHLLARFPKNPVGRLIRAQVDDVLGKRDRAAAGCREVLGDFPENAKARLLLAGLLFQTQKFAEAAAEYEEVRRRQPDALRPLLGLAMCRERLGRADDARPLTRELEERFPDNGAALLECGRSALNEGRLADAERLLRRAAALIPFDDEAHYQLGLCLERAGKIDESRSHLERFKQIRADLERLDALLKAVVGSPQDPAPRREAGLICLRNGQPDEGLRWLLGALEVAPADKATHQALAEVYEARGDAGRAGHHRERAR
jgi:predicted Zn-dependent protease